MEPVAIRVTMAKVCDNVNDHIQLRSQDTYTINNGVPTYTTVCVCTV